MTPWVHLTRDERLCIQTLRSVEWTYEAIAAYIKCTQHQIQYMLTHTKQFTLRKRPERSVTTNQKDINQIVDFVQFSKTTRQMTWSRIPFALNMLWITTRKMFDILRRAEFQRYVTRAKPFISETNRQKRLRWALKHKDWTSEQWNTVLWTNEIWVTGGQHTKTYVTRRADEKLNPTCVVDKIQRKQEWMFWGCFSESKLKGPGFFWKKD